MTAAQRAVIRAEARMHAAWIALSRAQPEHLRPMYQGRHRRACSEVRQAYRLAYARADKGPTIAMARALRGQGMSLLQAWDLALERTGLPSRSARGGRLDPAV